MGLLYSFFNIHVRVLYSFIAGKIADNFELFIISA
jgi:hypothetical protein